MRILAVFLILLLAVPLAAADLSGTWNFHVVLDAGTGDPTFVIIQKGDTLNGTYTGTLGEAKIRGTVKGEDVEIIFEAQNETIQYTGKMDGPDKFKGSVKYGSLGSGTFTAERKK
jgi:hypothetical protein